MDGNVNTDTKEDETRPSPCQLDEYDPPGYWGHFGTERPRDHECWKHGAGTFIDEYKVCSGFKDERTLEGLRLRQGLGLDSLETNQRGGSNGVWASGYLQDQLRDTLELVQGFSARRFIRQRRQQMDPGSDSFMVPHQDVLEALQVNRLDAHNQIMRDCLLFDAITHSNPNVVALPPASAPTAEFAYIWQPAHPVKNREELRVYIAAHFADDANIHRRVTGIDKDVIYENWEHEDHDLYMQTLQEMVNAGEIRLQERDGRLAIYPFDGFIGDGAPYYTLGLPTQEEVWSSIPQLGISWDMFQRFWIESHRIPEFDVINWELTTLNPVAFRENNMVYRRSWEDVIAARPPPGYEHTVPPQMPPRVSGLPPPAPPPAPTFPMPQPVPPVPLAPAPASTGPGTMPSNSPWIANPTIRPRPSRPAASTTHPPAPSPAADPVFTPTLPPATPLGTVDLPSYHMIAHHIRRANTNVRRIQLEDTFVNFIPEGYLEPFRRWLEQNFEVTRNNPELRRGPYVVRIRPGAP